MAACSTTRRNSNERSGSMQPLNRNRRTRKSVPARSGRPPLRRLRAVRRQLAPGRMVRAIAEQIIGLHQLVNLARAFVDHRPLAVAEEAAGGIFVGVAAVSYT